MLTKNMIKTLTWLIYLICLGAGFGSAHAQSDVIEQYKEVMPKVAFEQTLTNAEFYRDYLLGFCFEKVRSKALVKHSVSYSEWDDLGDAEVTLDLKLFNPKISPDEFSIVDLSESEKSCWTQHDTVAAALSMQPVMDEILKVPSESLSVLESDAGEGFNQRTFLYNPNDGLDPVAVYLYITYSPNAERILGIVQEVTVTEKQN